MAVTPYRALTFQPYSLLSTDIMNQEAANVQWIFENTPRTLYAADGVVRNTNLKISAGLVSFGKSKQDTASKDVTFRNFFARGCRPLITLGVNSAEQRKIHAVYYGLNGRAVDHRGFRVGVEIAASGKYDRIRPFNVTWMALGY